MKKKTAERNYLEEFLKSPNGKIFAYALMFWGIMIFALGILGFMYLSQRSNHQNVSSRFLSSFDKCIAEGGIIESSYPRRCLNGGTTYQEEINKVDGSLNQKLSFLRKNKLDSYNDNDVLTDYYSSDKYSAFKKYYEDNPSNQQIKADSSWVSNELSYKYLPLGWEFTQYRFEDGVVSTIDPYTSNSELTGLSKVLISNSRGNILMEMRGLLGVGGDSGCNEIYRFSDSNPLYIDSRIGFNNALNSSSISGDMYDNKIIDIQNYREIEMLGVRVRRSGNTLYKDFLANDNYFDARCGLEHQIISFNNIGASYTFDRGSVFNTPFTISISSNATQGELTELDRVIESLEVKAK